MALSYPVTAPLWQTSNESITTENTKVVVYAIWIKEWGTMQNELKESTGLPQTFEEFETSWNELANRPENKNHKRLSKRQLFELYEILNNDVRRI